MIQIRPSELGLCCVMGSGPPRSSDISGMAHRSEVAMKCGNASIFCHYIGEQYARRKTYENKTNLQLVELGG